MGIASSHAAGYGRKPKPKRSLMPIINRLESMKKPKGGGRVAVAATEKKKRKPEEAPQTKGAGLASNKSSAMANPKRM
jgi:hypothetical protein